MTIFLTRLTVAVLLVYFTAHALAGEQGLFRWIHIQGEEARLRARLQDLRAEKVTLEAQLVRLRTDSLDLDYIDQIARSRLALVLPGEIILHDDAAPSVAAD